MELCNLKKTIMGGPRGLLRVGVGGSSGKPTPSIKGGFPLPFGHTIMVKSLAAIRLSYTLCFDAVI